MAIRFLHHVHIFCSDIEVSCAFWCALNDGKEAYRRKYGDDDGIVVDLASGIRLALQKKSGMVSMPAAPVPGANHFGFAVTNLEEELERVLALPGVSLHQDIMNSPLARFAFIKGPDGVLVELMETKDDKK